MPRMNSTLAILEPTMLPIASCGTPARTASIAATSSGADVPKPTMVMPMTSGGTPITRARRTPPRTSSSPPAISKTNPVMSVKNSKTASPRGQSRAL